MQQNELIKFLLDEQSIYYSTTPITLKSKQQVYFDTDIRSTMQILSKLNKLTENIYQLIPSTILDNTDYFIGVPETGNILAIMLNILHAKYTNNINIPINMIRQLSKNYQSTLTQETVLPANINLKATLIEDDIVTGGSVLCILKRMQNIINIRSVVTVIDRDKSVGDLIQERFDINYIALINIRDILKFLTTTRHIQQDLQCAIQEYCDKSC